MFKLIQPLLNNADSESVHDAMRGFAPMVSAPGVRQVVRALYNFEDHRLTQTAPFGVEFRNPVGLAAGFDKYAAFLDVMPLIGMGFMEIGSISALPRLGNPKPRLFRLPKDHAVVNRMGLNNEGAEVLAKQLAKKQTTIPLGINIVKTNDEKIMGRDGILDFIKSYVLLAPYASYITANVSCPNTLEGKTFEDPEALEELLTALDQAAAVMKEDNGHAPALLVKFSPDRTRDELLAMVRIAQKHHVAGYVLTNTTTQRDNLKTPEMKMHEIGLGGLSGRPLFEHSLAAIKTVYGAYASESTKPFIIGVGGVDSADKAYDMIRAGASLIQVYTGLVYQGPALVKKINKGLLHWMQRDGLSSITQAIGADYNGKQ